MKNEIEGIKHDCINVNINTIDNDNDVKLQYKHYLLSIVFIFTFIQSCLIPSISFFIL